MATILNHLHNSTRNMHRVILRSNISSTCLAQAKSELIIKC